MFTQLLVGHRGLSLPISLEFIGCVLGRHGFIAVLDVAITILKLNHVDGIALAGGPRAFFDGLLDALPIAGKGQLSAFGGSKVSGNWPSPYVLARPPSGLTCRFQFFAHC